MLTISVVFITSGKQYGVIDGFVLWNENLYRNEIWENHSLSRNAGFFLFLGKRLQVWACGTDLGWIWQVQLF